MAELGLIDSSKTASGTFFSGDPPWFGDGWPKRPKWLVLGEMAKMTQKARFSSMAISGAISAAPFALGGSLGPIGVPRSSAGSNMPKTFDLNENGAN